MSYTGLHPEQQYVFEIAKGLGIVPRILNHTRPTVSCAEKLELLKEESPAEYYDWTLDRIVKTLYLGENGSGNGKLIGIITPEIGKIKQHEILSSILGISKTQARNYLVSTNRVPRGMSFGTCTPFPLESNIATERGKIAGFLIVDYKPIWNEDVNISIGGPEKTGLRTSMHLPYWVIPEILKRQFGEDRMRLFKLNL